MELLLWTGSLFGQLRSRLESDADFDRDVTLGAFWGFGRCFRRVVASRARVVSCRRAIGLFGLVVGFAPAQSVLVVGPYLDAPEDNPALAEALKQATVTWPKSRHLWEAQDQIEISEACWEIDPEGAVHLVWNVSTSRFLPEQRTQPARWWVWQTKEFQPRIPDSTNYMAPFLQAGDFNRLRDLGVPPKRSIPRLPGPREVSAANPSGAARGYSGPIETADRGRLKLSLPTRLYVGGMHSAPPNAPAIGAVWQWPDLAGFGSTERPRLFHTVLISNPDSEGGDTGRMPARLVSAEAIKLDRTIAGAEALRMLGVELSVDRNGTVTSIAPLVMIPPELVVALRKNLARWRFEPGSENGEAVESVVRVRIPIVVLGASGTRVPGERAAELMSLHVFERAGWATDLPSGPDHVELEVLIDEEGFVRAVQPLGASNPWIETAMLNTLESWRYRPAQREGKPIQSIKREVLDFDSVAGGLLHVDAPGPTLEYYAPPVYPFEKLAKGKKGTVSLTVRVLPDGNAEVARVKRSSAPQFLDAATAAIETARYRWDESVQQDESCEIDVEFEFDRWKWSASPMSYEDEQILRLLRKARTTMVEEHELDRPLRLLTDDGIGRQRTAEDVDASESAEIEFVVDVLGIPRLPRIVRATNSHFAALMAQRIVARRYQAPTKGGGPVDVLVRATFGTPRR